MAGREAYMPRPPGVEINNAEGHGWGAGWPHCQSSKMVKVRRAGVAVSVRREIAPLVAILFEATEQLHGYNIKAGQTGGYHCRAIAGSDRASNHSWGLAVDLNWNENPWQSPFRSNLPPAVIPMWWACGFFWGGWYTGKPDPMHFEYVFRPRDVARHLEKARQFMAFRDDGDARALIYRVDGILAMRDTVDNHVNNPAEPNQLARAIRAIAADAAAARDAARAAESAAADAAQSARAVAQAAAQLDEALLESLLERVVRRVLDATPGAQPPAQPGPPAVETGPQD